MIKCNKNVLGIFNGNFNTYTRNSEVDDQEQKKRSGSFLMMVF